MSPPGIAWRRDSRRLASFRFFRAARLAFRARARSSIDITTSGRALPNRLA